MPVIRRKLLSFSFSGKRNHGSLDLINGPLEELFNAFESEFRGTRLQLISGLADGADQIASSLFIRHDLQKGPKDGERLLGAVLPLGVKRYRSTIADRSCFDSLYEKCHYRLELDGGGGAERADMELDGGADGETADGDFKDAYRQQARILPRLCDVFIAVASKREEGAKGGTKDSVLAALLLHKPVVFFNLDDLRFYFYKSMDEWVYSLAGPVTVSEIIHSCTQLYHKEIDSPFDRPRQDLFYRLRRWIWNRYERWFNKEPAGNVPAGWQAGVGDPFFSRMQAHRRRVSEISKYFMFQYRGGYLLSYFLAIVAIFIAVDTSTLHLFKKELSSFSESAATISLVSCGILKVVVIALIIGNTEKVNKKQYNAKAIKYRYAAERLRTAAYFSIFGMVKIPLPFVGNHVNQHLKTYPGEAIFRKIVSQLIIQFKLHLVIDKGYLLRSVRVIRDEWLGGQLTYYRKDSEKMRAIDESLIAIARTLGYVVLAIVIVEIIETVLPDWVRSQIGGVVVWLVPVLVGITILLPGIITTLNSVHFQSEAKRLAIRNDMMINQIQKVIDRLDEEIERIELEAGREPLLRILSILDEVASLTTDEVAEWTMIYEKAVPDP